MANRSRSGRATRSSSRRVSGSGKIVPRKRRLDPSGFDEAEEAGRRAASTDSGYGLRENRRASAAALEAAASTPTSNTPRVASSPTSSKRRSVKGGTVADAQEKKKRGTGSAKQDSKPGSRSSKSQVAKSSTASRSRVTMPKSGAGAQKYETGQKRKRTQSQSQTQDWAHAASTTASAAKATRSLQTRGHGGGRGRGGGRPRGRVTQTRGGSEQAGSRRTDPPRIVKRGASSTRVTGRSSRGRGRGRRVATSTKSDSGPSFDKSESQDESDVSNPESESDTKTEAAIEDQAAHSSDAGLDDTFANKNGEAMAQSHASLTICTQQKTEPIAVVPRKGTIPTEQQWGLEQTTALSPADFSLLYHAMQRKQWDIWQQHPMPTCQMPGHFSSDGTPSPPRPMDYPHSLKAQTTEAMDYAAETSFLNGSEENDPDRATKKDVTSGEGVDEIGCQTEEDETDIENLDAPQRKHEKTMDELMTLPVMKHNVSKTDRFGRDGTANLYEKDGDQSADQEQEAIWDDESIDSFVWATRETPEYEKSAEEIAGRKAWAEKLELEEKENAGHMNELSGFAKAA